MGDIKKLVGFTGITEGHKWPVNDLPFIHDELVRNVSYGRDKTPQALAEYFNRAVSDSYNQFTAEVLHHLSCTGKFSEVLLRFPEGRMTKGSAGIALLAGQNITQTYNLESVLQYGIVTPTKIILYTKGPHKIRLSVRLDFQDIIQGSDLFSETIENAAADETYLKYHEFDLSGDEFKVKINSKNQDQLVIELQILDNSTLMEQTFIDIEPTVAHSNQKFSVAGGFSQGFSDGFSVAKGLLIGTTNPLVSMANGTVEFDVDAFIAQNADKLAYCFAHRVASRLLGDKLTGVQLNIFTNSDPELTKMQLAENEKGLARLLKKSTAALLFDIQSTATPPIVLQGQVGYEMGGFLDSGGYIFGSYKGDEGAYPQNEFL